MQNLIQQKLYRLAVQNNKYDVYDLDAMPEQKFCIWYFRFVGDKGTIIPVVRGREHWKNFAKLHSNTRNCFL